MVELKKNKKEEKAERKGEAKKERQERELVEREKEEKKQNEMEKRSNIVPSPPSTFDPLIRFLQPFLECREITYSLSEQGRCLSRGESRVPPAVATLFLG